MAPGGVMTGDLYNAFGAMHGTIMVFLAIVPLAFAAFGNFVVPLQIGAPDMTFPRINMVSYQCYFAGGVVMLASFFIPGGAARSGWTSYSPLASMADTANRIDGQTFWLIGMVLLITSSLLGAVNFIATIIQLRAKGMSWMRLPFFVWAQFVTALPAAARLSSARSSRRDAAHGQHSRYEFLPAERPRGQRATGRCQRRRQSAACGSTCSGSSAIRKFTF